VSGASPCLDSIEALLELGSSFSEGWARREEGAVVYEQGVRVFVNGDRVYVDEEEDYR